MSSCRFFALDAGAISSDDESPSESNKGTPSPAPSPRPTSTTPTPGSSKKKKGTKLLANFEEVGGIHIDLMSPLDLSKSPPHSSIKFDMSSVPLKGALLSGDKLPIADDLKASRAMSFEFMASDNEADTSLVDSSCDEEGYGHLVSLPATPSPCRTGIIIPDGVPNSISPLTRRPARPRAKSGSSAGSFDATLQSSLLGLTPTSDGRIAFPRMDLIDLPESDESAASSPAGKAFQGLGISPKIYSPGSPFATTDDIERLSRSPKEYSSFLPAFESARKLAPPQQLGSQQSPFSPFQYTPNSASAAAAPMRRQRSMNTPGSGHTPLISRSRSTSTFESNKSFASPFLPRATSGVLTSSHQQQAPQPPAKIPSFEEFQRAVAGSGEGKQFSAVPSAASSDALPTQSPFKTVLPENVLMSPPRSLARKRIPFGRSHSAPTISETPQGPLPPSSEVNSVPWIPSPTSIAPNDRRSEYSIVTPTGSPESVVLSPVNVPAFSEMVHSPPRTSAGLLACTSTDSYDMGSNSRASVKSPLQLLGPPMQVTTIPPQRSSDAISAAIFSALFESETGSNPGRRRNWDSDSEDDDEEGGNGGPSLPKVRKVDEIWFKRLMTTSLLTSTALDYAMKRVQLMQSQPDGPGNDLLSQYISPCFITSITEQLTFEDDRFDSPRVSILKALYRNSASMSSPIRSMILRSLVETLVLRQSRCRDCMNIARLLNVEVNFVGSKGLLQDGLSTELVMNTLAREVDSIGGKKDYWGTGEERKGIKIRDNNAGVIELLSYLVMVELTECQQHPLALTSPNGSSEHHSSPCKNQHLTKESCASCSLKYCWNRLILLQKSVCLCLGCYGGALGLSSGGEFAEQPSQFTGIITCLENIFKVSALIPFDMVSALGDYEDFLPLLNNPSLGIDSVATRNKISSQRVPLELQSTNAEMKMVYAVATSLLKHWPDNEIVNGITGAGHVQMLAFLKAAELLVLSAGAFPLHLPRLLANIKTQVAGGVKKETSNESRKTDSKNSIVLKLPPHQRDCIHNIFLKLFSCMCSSHFKVSLQSLALLNNPNILKKYFIDNNDDMDGFGGAGAHGPVGDLRIKLANGEQVPATLREKWDDMVDRALLSEVSTFKQDLLSRLVDSLRSNRAHWHPQVFQ
jgi:hypothetical protein